MNLSRPVELRRVTIKTAPHDAARSIRDAILSGALPPGTPLVERRLSVELGISRAPVREALRILEHEGLVVTVPYTGTHVAELGPDRMEQLRSLRLVLEPFAAERALPHLDSAAFKLFKQHVASMNRALRLGRSEELNQYHSLFHRTLYEHADHPLVMQIWTMVEGQHALIAQSDRRNLEVERLTPQYHERYIAALASGDLERIRAEIVKHINWSYESAIPEYLNQQNHS